MTDITHTASASSDEREASVERNKNTGLFECLIVSLSGLAVTMLAIGHYIPTAMQLTVMQ
jgi:hypothetical protein